MASSYLDFIALPSIQSVSVKEPTLKMWHHIFMWVEKHGYADTADSPEFIGYVQGWRKVSPATIGSHLAKMAAAGLLKRHVLRRKLSSEAKEDLLNPILGMFAGTSLPTTLVRYTLPNVVCPLELKAAVRKAEKIDRFWSAAAENAQT